MTNYGASRRKRHPRWDPYDDRNTKYESGVDAVALAVRKTAKLPAPRVTFRSTVPLPGLPRSVITTWLDVVQAGSVMTTLWSDGLATIFVSVSQALTPSAGVN